MLFDDLPLETQKSHKKLHPVFKALMQVKDNSPIDGAVKSVKLKDGSIILNGKSYDLDSLKDLPPTVATDKLFTITNEGITVFFRCYRSLSNHDCCNFEVNGKIFTSMEKYLMVQKAKLFNDIQTLEKMRKEDDPFLKTPWR